MIDEENVGSEVEEQEIISAEDEGVESMGSASENESENEDSDEAKLSNEGGNSKAQCCLFVRNVPFECDQPTLFRAFSPFGPIKYATLVNYILN